jgi:hypothetical protein
VLALLVAAAVGTPSVAVAEDTFSGARARATVATVAALGPRPAGSAAERRAGALVAARLRALGWRVVIRPFALPRGGESRNVVALPEGPVRAVVVAHLDGVAEGPAANDNASGVAVLLELARALAGERGVMLVATGAEERVETGSRIHLGSQRLLRGLSAAGRRRIRLALALDMVGVGTRLHVRGLAAAPGEAARQVLARAPGATYLQDPGWSDHAELSRAGVAATWLEWRADACWHRSCDTADRVDPQRLAAAGRIALAAVRAALVE